MYDALTFETLDLQCSFSVWGYVHHYNFVYQAQRLKIEATETKRLSLCLVRALNFKCFDLQT